MVYDMDYVASLIFLVTSLVQALGNVLQVRGIGRTLRAVSAADKGEIQALVVVCPRRVRVQV